MKTYHRMHTELVLLAGGYPEVACPNPEAPPLRRHWQIRRTVDYRSIPWC